MIHDLFYAIGYAIGEAESFLAGNADTEDPYATDDPDSPGHRHGADHLYGPNPPYSTDQPDGADRYGPDHPYGSDHQHHPDRAADVERADSSGASDLPDPGRGAAAIGGTAATWVLARLLRPHPVHWPRAITAGLAGTALLDLASRVEKPRAAQQPPPLSADGALRYLGGITTAAAYAAFVYSRLPGSPAVRGLLFGAAEAAASAEGGALALLRRLSPGIAYPLEWLSPPTLPATGPLARLAFGLGLALYRGPDEER